VVSSRAFCTSPLSVCAVAERVSTFSHSLHCQRERAADAFESIVKRFLGCRRHWAVGQDGVAAGVTVGDVEVLTGDGEERQAAETQSPFEKGRGTQQVALRRP
jgi:hypothetical protein